MSFRVFTDERTGKPFRQSERGVDQMIADMKRAQARLLSGKTIVDRSVPEASFEHDTTIKVGRKKTSKLATVVRGGVGFGSAPFQFAERRGRAVSVSYMGDRIDRFKR